MNALTRRNFLKTTTSAGLATLPATRALTALSRQDALGVRGEFPITNEMAYLNSASAGPVSRTVRDALDTYADERMFYRNPGYSQIAKAGARAKFANLFGADQDEIAFLSSTSDGENVVVSAMDWKASDNVVLDELHFTTSFVLYRELEKRTGVELRIVPSRDGRTSIEDFEARTDAQTRLLSVAWVSNRNGFRYDLPGGFFIGSSVRAALDTYYDAANTEAFSEEGCWVWDAQVGYEQENWSVTVFGRNLLEEDYYSFINPQIAAGTPGDPQLFGIRVDLDIW